MRELSSEKNCSANQRRRYSNHADRNAKKSSLQSAVAGVASGNQRSQIWTVIFCCLASWVRSGCSFRIERRSTRLGLSQCRCGYFCVSRFLQRYMPVYFWLSLWRWCCGCVCRCRQSGGVYVSVRRRTGSRNVHKWPACRRRTRRRLGRWRHLSWRL